MQASVQTVGLLGNVQTALGAMGFKARCGARLRAHRRDGVTCVLRGGWVALSGPARRLAPDAMLEPLGDVPGLRKAVVRAPGRARDEVQIPLALLAIGAEEEERAALACRVLESAVTILDGKAPSPELVPTPKDMEDLIPREKLSICAGEFLSQGRVGCSEGHAVARFPVVALPAGLPPARRWAMARLIGDVSRLRLVRCGVRADSVRSEVVLETDFAGLPREVWPYLAQVALPSLHWAFSWIVGPMTFVAESTLESSALKVVCHQSGVSRGKELSHVYA